MRRNELIHVDKVSVSHDGDDSPFFSGAGTIALFYTHFLNAAKLASRLQP